MRLGAIPDLQRASTWAGHKAIAGYSPAVVLAPRHWAHVGVAWCAGMVRRAISHMKAAISRAMAQMLGVDALIAAELPSEIELVIMRRRNERMADISGAGVNL